MPTTTTIEALATWADGGKRKIGPLTVTTSNTAPATYFTVINAAALPYSKPSGAEGVLIVPPGGISGDIMFMSNSSDASGVALSGIYPSVIWFESSVTTVYFMLSGTTETAYMQLIPL